MPTTLTTLRDRVIPRIMWAQAILYLSIGATWYTAPTESRLRGLVVLGGDRPHIAVALLLTVGGVITIAGAIAPAPRYGCGPHPWSLCRVRDPAARRLPILPVMARR